jgi:hypothetical protein
VTRTRAARDLLLAVDLSGSMASTDLSQPGAAPETRLDAVKEGRGRVRARGAQAIAWG